MCLSVFLSRFKKKTNSTCFLKCLTVVEWDYSGAFIVKNNIKIYRKEQPELFEEMMQSKKFVVENVKQKEIKKIKIN